MFSHQPERLLLLKDCALALIFYSTAIDIGRNSPADQGCYMVLIL